jgi:glycosyltransferase involved in cell wall biosynthesis
MSKKIVFFVESDFTVLQSGSHVRFKASLDFLIYHFSNVIVYSYFEHDSLPWTSDSVERFKVMFPEVELILEHRTRALKALTKFKNLALVAFPTKAKNILALKFGWLTPRYMEILNHQEDYFVVLNFLDMITVANGFKFDNFIIDTQDLKFLRFGKLRDLPIHSLKVLGRVRSELGILSVSPALIAISASEATVYKTLLSETKCFFVPTFTQNEFVTTNQDVKNYKYDLIFVGSEMRFNADGVIRFISENRDWLALKLLAIVGKVGEDQRLKQLVKDMPNVHLLGFVDDVSSVYKQSKAAISPVDGTGLKIKILEALANGLPVFASDHSLDGLPKGYEESVFPIEISVMSDVLDSPEALIKARNSTIKYLQKFDENSDKEKLKNYIEKTIS